MTASMLIEGPLPDLPSASGVEILDAGAYVIGDDSPFLHQFDAGTAFAAGRWPPSPISPIWSAWPPSFGPLAGSNCYS